MLDKVHFLIAGFRRFLPVLLHQLLFHMLHIVDADNETVSPNLDPSYFELYLLTASENPEMVDMAGIGWFSRIDQMDYFD